MKRVNDGMILTNDNCIGCNKCISKCPVTGANLSILETEGSKIKVSSKKCIHCGSCIQTCNQGAREYVDDTVDFLKAIEAENRISVIIDPTFQTLYQEELPNIIGYLKSIGVRKVYDGGYGAEISLWGHTKYILDHEDDEDKPFIGNTCSAMISYLESNAPDILDMIIPIQSPAICTAIYVKKYLNDTNILAMISPCPSRKDEMLDNGGIISYNITVENFMNHIKDIDISEFSGEFDLDSLGIGAMGLFYGGFRSLMEYFVPRDKVITSRNGIQEEYFEIMKIMEKDPSIKPFFSEVDVCGLGCTGGPGMPSARSNFISSCRKIQSIKKYLKDKIGVTGNPVEDFKSFEKNFEEIDINDFLRVYHNKYFQMTKVPENVYEDIFNSMHKNTEAKRRIDCGCCGYNSCREMAKAIAYGYNKMENCIHFMNDELTKRYYSDSMTGINNKEGFKYNVQRLYDKNPDKEYVIGVVSLNQLNLINDLHGFSLGDALIRKAAGLATAFTAYGGCCGRLGGGEFLICVENTRRNMDILHKSTIFSFDDIGVSFPLSFRAGLYVDSDRNESMETMINYASMARDKIEEDGISTCLYYNDELKERLAAEAMVTSQMVKATENKEFVAYFQPQYSHRRREIIGAETLCRWLKKDGSVISPGLFIPIFEKNGFIKTLDKYMWELAFKTVTKWSNEDIKQVPISVNISRISLDEADFVDTIKDLYAKYPIDPALLHFEITESAYSDRQDIVARKINALRDMGFLVAMDDFGSGYSSLNVLKDMPLDILKLDMGFLRGRNQDRGESIIRNVVSMVKELDLEIITEGVETMEQAEFLKHVGCDTIQGYLYARPMPQEDYENLLKNTLQFTYE